MRKINLTVNDEKYQTFSPDNITLLTLLREYLHLTGTKEGCAAGECGACAVIFNSKIVNSCMILAPEADGAVIHTIEGESKNGKLSKLQQSFIDNHAFQCGFCTPGMIMSARALLNNNPNPTEHDVVEALEGNLCRCTGYTPIIEAVLAAAEAEGVKQ